MTETATSTPAPLPKMSNIAAIKTYFEKDGGRVITMEELKALTSEDRAELGGLANEALGTQ